MNRNPRRYRPVALRASRIDGVRHEASPSVIVDPWPAFYGRAFTFVAPAGRRLLPPGAACPACSTLGVARPHLRFGLSVVWMGALPARRRLSRWSPSAMSQVSVWNRRPGRTGLTSRSRSTRRCADPAGVDQPRFGSVRPLLPPSLKALSNSPPAAAVHHFGRRMASAGRPTFLSEHAHRRARLGAQHARSAFVGYNRSEPTASAGRHRVARQRFPVRRFGGGGITDVPPAILPVQDCGPQAH